jgi:hypothetical protein
MVTEQRHQKPGWELRNCHYERPPWARGIRFSCELPKADPSLRS